MFDTVESDNRNTMSYMVAEFRTVTEQIQRLVFSNLLGYQRLNTHAKNVKQAGRRLDLRA